MRQITGLTTDPKQQFDAVIEGYDVATIYLEWKPNQTGWFINVIWDTFAVYNLRVTTSFNILYQFKDIIPFGIRIDGIGLVDPVTDDAWTKYNQFYILDESDKQSVEDFLNG